MHEFGLIGEPFWVIAEVYEAGLSTGSYYAPHVEGCPTIPLFISKKYAESYLSHIVDRESWAVFGMPQYKLKVLIGFAKLGGVRFAIVQGAPEPNGCIELKEVLLEDLELDFVV